MLRRYDYNFTKVENYKLTYKFQKFSLGIKYQEICYIHPELKDLVVSRCVCDVMCFLPVAKLNKLFLVSQCLIQIT